MDDEKIIALYFQRQSAAIEQSDLKYGGLLRRTSYNILSSREDSEECVNDSLLAAWDTIPPEKPRSLGAYLVSITRRISLSRLPGRATAFSPPLRTRIGTFLSAAIGCLSR